MVKQKKSVAIAEAINSERTFPARHEAHSYCWKSAQNSMDIAAELNYIPIDPQRVLLISLRGAQLFLGRQFHDRKTIAYLFEIEGPEEEIVLMDKDGEEAPTQNGFFLLNPTSHYTIATESDIQQEEETEWTLQERGEHIVRVDNLRKRFLQKHWRPVHHWLYSCSPGHLSNTVFNPLVKLTEEGATLDLDQLGVSKLTPTGLYIVPELFSSQFVCLIIFENSQSNLKVTDLLDEVLQLDATGLPLRQPNTMNRYGCGMAES